MGIKKLPISMILSLALLLMINVISTTFFPASSFEQVRIPFNILLVLYLSFRLDVPYISLLILIIQFFHSSFTLEGWAHGTFTGVVLALVITIVRNSINFNTPIATILAVQIFQLLWFVLLSGLLYIKMGDSTFLLHRFYAFIPESLFLSILSPLFFKWLDRIWNFREIGPQMGR